MTETIAASDFHELTKPVSPRLSPDGESVAYVRRVPDDEESYERTIYLASTDGTNDRRFTVSEGSDAEPRFSPSGDRLAFTSTRGKDDDTQQLWVVPTDGGEARQVTNVVGGVSNIRWSPDGTHVAFVQSVTSDDREADRDLAVPDEYEPDESDPRVIDRTVYRSAQSYVDGRRPNVYLADVTSDPSEAVTRVTAQDADHASPSWGGETLYYGRSVGDDPDDSTAYEILAVDLADADTASDAVDVAETTVHETTGWPLLAATSDDRVAHVFVEEEQSSMQQSELHVYDRAADAIHEVTAEVDRTLGYDGRPQWGPDEESVYFVTPDEGERAIWRAPGDASAAPERAYRGGDVHGMHVRDRTVVARSEWNHPGDLFLQTADGERRLTTVNEAYLDEVAVSEPEPLAVESEQGRVEGWVLHPPEFDPSETYPLAVEVHGGPHAMWTTSGTMWHEFQTLAARGYVVCWSNPRGSAGFGETFMQAIERDWGEVTETDVMSVVREVADRAYVDETNAFLTGGSFGRFQTAWMVGSSDYFRGAVAQRGVYDLTGFYGSTDGAYRLVEGDFDTTPGEEPAFLWEKSPVGHASEVETPTLVLHSDDDYRTPANTAELFYRLLRKHGVETRMVRYPREGHELSRSGEPGHVVDRIERIARWFDGYSEHHDAPRALDRPDDDGLSAGDDEDANDEN